MIYCEQHGAVYAPESEWCPFCGVAYLILTTPDDSCKVTSPTTKEEQ